MRPSTLSLLALLLLPSTAWAQGPTHAAQTWLGVFVQGRIHGRLFVMSDLHHRMYGDFSPYWTLVRPGVGVQLAPGMFVAAGYAWTPSWRAQGLAFEDRVDEHRAWEQWQHEAPVADGALRLQARARLEQRWRPSVSDDVGHRLRLMARVTLPLGGPWLLAVWDELFVTFNDTAWGQRAGYDQNRFFAGPGVWAVRDALRFELGYFNQHLRRAGNAGGDLVNHAVMLNTYVTWR